MTGASDASARSAAPLAAPAIPAHACAPRPGGDGARIRTSEVMRYLGHRGQEVDEALATRIDVTISRCDRELDPRGLWRPFDVTRGPATPEAPAGTVRIEGTTIELVDASIVEYLAGARGVALLAVTLGVASSRNLALLGATDAFAQMVYDASCSELVERGADGLEAEVVAWASERGLYTGYRYSPGYGNWRLSANGELLGVLDAQRKLGVTLTDTRLMVPNKSVTALIGLFDEPPAQAKRGCKDCNCFEFCQLRRSGTPCWARERLRRGGEE